MDRLSDEQRSALLAALNNGAARYGQAYNGPPINIALDRMLLDLGIPQLRPSHFVNGGFLTLVGKQLAELLRETSDNDDYSL